MNVNVSSPGTRQLAILVFALAVSVTAWAVKETDLYIFTQNGATGDFPAGGVIMDKAGNLYGTTALGGNLSTNCNRAGCGVVYELTPTSQPSGSWTQTVLYAFQGGADGAQPECTLVIDAIGNLYGTGSIGGAQGYGVVFKLSPPSHAGGSWTETVLYDFPGRSFNPIENEGDLVIDRAGSLYGATYYGGAGSGTVFEVSPPSAPGGTWTGSVLYNFLGGSDGANPLGGLLLDAQGALYGTTSAGGNSICSTGCGTLFRLSPPSQSGAPWTKDVLYGFDGNDGKSPRARLVFDKGGSLYGTTATGGSTTCPNGYCGNVFRLSPPSQSGDPWTETVLHQFPPSKNSQDGRFPTSGVILDGKGNLYGTAKFGGTQNVGAVFELSPPIQPGGLWTERRFSMGGTGGAVAYPSAGLIFGPGKSVIGTGNNDFGGGGVFLISQ